MCGPDAIPSEKSANGFRHDDGAFRLTDAVERNRSYPASFHIPGEAEIDGLSVGDHVKVCVEFGRARIVPGTDASRAAAAASRAGTDANVDGERFWVQIAWTDGKPGRDRGFRGRVDNDLVYTDHHGLSYNDELVFDGRHVLAIHT